MLMSRLYFIVGLCVYWIKKENVYTFPFSWPSVSPFVVTQSKRGETTLRLFLPISFVPAVHGDVSRLALPLRPVEGEPVSSGLMEFSCVSDNSVVTGGRCTVHQSVQLFLNDEGSVDNSQIFHHFDDCLLFSHSRSAKSIVTSFLRQSHQPIAAMVLAVDSTAHGAQFNPSARRIHDNGTSLLAPF